MLTADQIIFSVMLAFVGALMWFVPTMKGPDAFFGIPVTAEFYRSPEARRYLLWYRVCVLLMTAVPLAAFTVAARSLTWTPGLFLGLFLLPALGPMVPLVIVWYAMKPYEAQTLPAEPELPAGKVSQWTYVTPWVEVVLLGLLVLCVALTVWRYPQLPERIPVHWNAVGQADGWQSKAPWPVVSLLLIMGVMHAMMLWLVVGLAQMSVQLPAQRAEEFRVAHERYMRMWAGFFNLMRVTLVLIFGGIIWASLFGIERQAQGSAPPGMLVVLCGTAALLLSLPWLLVKTVRLRNAMREIAGPGFLESQAPTEGWIAGLFYYNRNDPALWVEKRVGVGWTFNFAHPMSWVFMGLLLVVPIGLAILATVGAKQ